MTNAISEITRRNIIDEFCHTGVAWAGRLPESEFLSQMFNLTSLPSKDHRKRDMREDVDFHRGYNWDGDDDWVFYDDRLDLLHCPDDVFLRFLSEMIHPRVRNNDAEVDKLLALFNRHLRSDGFQLRAMDMISGKPIFAAVRSLDAGVMQAHARKVADELASYQVSAQITRMQTSIPSDPALAIGSAKEFVETICKGILTARGAASSGREDLPKLVHMVREQLGLTINRRTDDTLGKTLGALATLTHGVAELRGQLGTGHGANPEVGRPPIEVATLAVNAAQTLGIFLWQMHQVQEQIMRDRPQPGSAE
jgi:hypothetical protein